MRSLRMDSVAAGSKRTLSYYHNDQISSIAGFALGPIFAVDEIEGQSDKNYGHSSNLSLLQTGEKHLVIPDQEDQNLTD
jgi:hypothetical protein